MSTSKEKIGEYLEAGYELKDVAVGGRMNDWYALFERTGRTGYERVWLPLEDEEALHFATRCLEQAQAALQTAQDAASVRADSFPLSPTDDL